ncbi:MAG: hypothetical protein M1817_004423 [Caeruleum heppii]|nr:MAG: hypothetical protein M1817_004423 [Caeruleum heppii]
MSLTNQAAWLDGAGQKLRVGPAGVTEPGPTELLVRNHAVAINPADWIVQDTGMIIKQWPAVLGCDVAGEVVQVGDNVKEWQEGQRVLAHAIGLGTGKPEHSTFQQYTIVPSCVTSPIPEDMTYEAACVIPLGLSTAAAGLYQSDLALPDPSTSPIPTGKTILVWAGSSSVGSSAIQLAVAAGLEVVTTASKHNFEYCKKLGAREVVDYRSPSVVEDLVAALPKGKVVGAFDAIGKRDTIMVIAQVLTQVGADFISAVQSAPEDLPANIKSKPIFATSVAAEPDGTAKAVYKDFLPAALASGQWKPAPGPKVVGTGLEQLQAGVDILRKGVSATKLVVTL